MNILRKVLIWALKILSLLLGFLIFWPIGSSIALVNWTKIVTFNGSEDSFNTVRTVTFGDTIRYVYLTGPPAKSTGFTIWGYPFGFDTGLLLFLICWAVIAFTWWTLYKEV